MVTDDRLLRRNSGPCQWIVKEPYGLMIRLYCSPYITNSAEGFLSAMLAEFDGSFGGYTHLRLTTLESLDELCLLGIVVEEIDF